MNINAEKYPYAEKYPNAIIESDVTIAPSSFIGYNAFISAGAHVSDGAYVGDASEIGRFATIGHRATLADGSVVSDSAYVADGSHTIVIAMGAMSVTAWREPSGKIGIVAGCQTFALSDGVAHAKALARLHGWPVHLVEPMMAMVKAAFIARRRRVETMACVQGDDADDILTAGDEDATASFDAILALSADMDAPEHTMRTPASAPAPWGALDYPTYSAWHIPVGGTMPTLVTLDDAPRDGYTMVMSANHRIVSLYRITTMEVAV